jgi:hypothetical protein
VNVVPDAATPAPGAANVPEEGMGEKQQKEEKKDKPTRTEKRAIAVTELGVFGVKGRVFFGLELRQRADQTIVGSDGVPTTDDVESLDLVLDSARLSLLYQSPDEWLSAEIEIEVADPDQVELRDTYLLAEHGPFSAKAGNFKLPTSAFELDSSWTLPSPRRGFVNELLTDFLDVAGRSPGLQLGFRERKGIEPGVMLGVFQGRVLVEHLGDDRDTELIDEASLRAQSWVARAQVELGKLDLGVFYGHRVGSRQPLRTHHAPVAGADAVFDDEFGDFGARVWLDAHVGESWYAHADKPPEDGEPWFFALRAIVAGRYGGTSDGMFYVEPFGALGLFDPDLRVAADMGREFVAGVNVGLWDRARLTLEGFLDNTARNFPGGYFNGTRGRTLGLTLTLGAAF